MSTIQNTESMFASGATSSTPNEPAIQATSFARGGNGSRAKAMQSRLARREPASAVTKAGKLFMAYKPSGSKVDYGDNKIGIMPNIGDVLESIAESAGIDLSDSEIASQFLEAIVTDVYVNPYSDKKAFEGEICVGNFKLLRQHIKTVIEPIIGNNHRRFARAMAPIIVQVMTDNDSTFGLLLDKRMSELNLSTRYEAITAFDGADALSVDRSAAQRAAVAKALAIGYRQTTDRYAVDNSAVSKLSGLKSDD